MQGNARTRDAQQSFIGELMQDPDPVKAGRVTHAMLQMIKIEIEELEKAYRGD